MSSALPTGVTHARVRYAETDSGGVVYHANYLAYFEVGRTELMRELGIPYRRFEEEENVILPVVDAQLRFRRPARYDDLLRIETELRSLSGARLTFHYRIFEDSGDELLCDGETTLACTDGATGKPRRLPEKLRALTA